VGKPDRAIFCRAASRLGMETAECLFAGDGPRLDVSGSTMVGMTSVWVRRYKPWLEGQTIRPRHTVDNLSEILHLVPARAGTKG
jgi:putative hydrolase of the HAD superfamily